MVGEPVLHPAKMPMVIVERGGVALTGAAVVHDDVLPATTRNWSAIDLTANRGGQITIPCAATGAASPAAAKYSGPKTARLFIAGLLDR